MDQNAVFNMQSVKDAQEIVRALKAGGLANVDDDYKLLAKKLRKAAQTILAIGKLK